MTEAKHEEAILTGEKTYYGVNTKKQSVIPERLQQLYDQVAEVYNGKGMYVYPSPIDHLRHEIMKVCNENERLKNKLRINTDCKLCNKYPDNRIDKAKEIIKIGLEGIKREFVVAGNTRPYAEEALKLCNEYCDKAEALKLCNEYCDKAEAFLKE